MQRLARLTKVPGLATSVHSRQLPSRTRTSVSGPLKRSASDLGYENEDLVTGVHTHDGPGLGLGLIRRGVEAIHRNHVETPDFLSEPKTASIIGAPMTYGQPFHGTDKGPQALLKAGLTKGLTKLGWRIGHNSELKFDKPSRSDPRYTGPGNCNLPYVVGKGNQKLAASVKKEAEEGNFVLTLGGDHSIGLGSVAGILSVRPDTGVIWVDAHADINTPMSSSSGNMHGMPLAFLMKLFDTTTVPGFEWLKDIPTLKPEQIVYIGLRDIDIGERAFLRDLNIHAYTMHHVDRYGIGKVVEMALEDLGDRPLHMSYDIDACDPVIAPSTGTAVRGGLSFREAHYVAESVAESSRLGSLDMVEVNPSLEEGEGEDETIELGLAITASALGNRIL